MTTVVFCGPTIDHETVGERLPDAVLLPPAQCGDILRALRIKPSTIVLIDGVFERVAAVWHKELLVALEDGVRVIGAASMGALRAAELSPFGMVGVGSIYEGYASGELVDDDDVAVLHAHDGSPLSEPLVNIRATLGLAVAEGVTTSAFATEVEAVAKRTFYASRSFEDAVRSAVDDAKEADALLAWVADKGVVDQKRLDAIAALEHSRVAAEAGRVAATDVPPTRYLRRVARSVACSAASVPFPRAFEDERVASASRFLGHAYTDLKRVAFLLAGLTDIAVAAGVVPTTEPGMVWFSPMPDDVARRTGVIDALAEQTVGWIEPSLDSTHLLDLLRLEGLYARLQRNESDVVPALAALAPDRAAPLVLTAHLWRLFDAATATLDLQPRTEELQAHVDEFRLEAGLADTAAMAHWLDANDLEPDGFVDLMSSWFRLSRTVLRGDMRPLAVAQPVDRVHWFRDALWATGSFERAQALEPPAILVPEDEAVALERDFRGGAYGAEEARRQLWPDFRGSPTRIDIGADDGLLGAARRLRDSFRP